MTFRDRLKKLRLENGMTQQDVADRLNIAKTTYSGYETGRRQPNMDKIQEIANIFHISVDYLMGNVNDPFFTLDNEAILDEINAQLGSNEISANKSDTTINTHHFNVAKLNSSHLIRLFEGMPGASALTRHPLETELLDYFGQLNALGQQRLVEFAETLAESSKYRHK